MPPHIADRQGQPSWALAAPPHSTADEEEARPRAQLGGAGMQAGGQGARLGAAAPAARSQAELGEIGGTALAGEGSSNRSWRQMSPQIALSDGTLPACSRVRERVWPDGAKTSHGQAISPESVRSDEVRELQRDISEPVAPTGNEHAN